MQLDVISWFLLTSFIGVFADKKMVEQGSSVVLFENVTADNAEKEVNVYVTGDENPTLVVTFKFVNGSIEPVWESENYRKISMDDKSNNIKIDDMDETYERKFYIQSSKILREVELTMSNKKEVEQDSLVLLFENVTADNAEKEVSLFVNGVGNANLIATFKYVNGSIELDWKADNYNKIFMDAMRNIKIANIDETYERKFSIQSSKRLGEVELTILKTNYSTTMRTALKETTQKDDALSDKKVVKQDSLVLLFKNVTADNAEKEVSLFVNVVETLTRIVTFKYVNGQISMDWNLKADNYSKIFMDAKRNIWIANIDETYERKFYIFSSTTLGEVELTILKTIYSTTIRTALKETTQKDDVLSDTSSETGYIIASIVLMVILILMVIIIVVIMQKDHIFAWIQCKKSNGVLQPVQITSPCDSANSTSCQLIWNRPADEYRLQKYILRYREIQSMEQPWPLGLFLSVDDIPSSTVSYISSPLAPGRCYQVEIQAINTQEHSCSNYFNFRTKESVPQPVQVTSHHDSPDSTSYQLMWDKPDDGGSRLINYIIRYCEVEIIPDRAEYELSKYLKPFKYVDNILPSTVSYKLSPLTPGRYYLVEIQAINTQGRSLKSFIFKTKEDETNPKFHRLSRKIERLQPRNNDTVFTDNKYTCKDEQKANRKLKKRPAEKLESLDSRSNDEQDAFLKDPVDQNF